MKVSLIMATIGRVQEVEQFMESLLNQSYHDFELIIIDQNQHPILQPTIEKFQPRLSMVYIPCLKQGLSLARNVGIEYASGKIICFPDDDCLYPPFLLEKIVSLFQTSTEIDTVSISWHDTNTKLRLKSFGSKEEWVNSISIWTQVSSITMFIKSEVLTEVGTFDEQLGLGPHSFWKGAEDKDLPIRILHKGKKIWYTPTLYVLHPAPTQSATTPEEEKIILEKTFQYSAAAGYVMRKHLYPPYLKVASVLVILGKLVMSLITLNLFDCKIRWASLRGRLFGFSKRVGKGI